MVETAEVLLRRSICARSGVSAAALGEDVGLFSAGVDEEDLHDAFRETCKALGVDSGLIASEATARPSPWLLTSLRHLGPLWPAADRARREIEATDTLPAEPTIRSLAETIRQGRVVPAGPDVPVLPSPPLSAGRVGLRAASVGGLALFAAPAFGFLACEPTCHACPMSISEAATAALPTSMAMLAAVGIAVFLPGLLHLRHKRLVAVAP